MQQFFASRFFKLVILTVVIAGAILLLINLVFLALGWQLPIGLQIVLTLLAAGYLVYRFFAGRMY